jgi:hypothetical protein
MKPEVESEVFDDDDDETINKVRWDEEKKSLMLFLSSGDRDDANTKEDSSSSGRTESAGHLACNSTFPSAEFESLMSSENFWSEFADLNEEVIRLMVTAIII